MTTLAAGPDEPRFSWIDLEPELGDMRVDVVSGLRRTPKQIAAKYFYDDRGSALFEQITALPEYYLTRSELAILATHAGEMTALFGDEYVLVEFGSGSCTKVKLLLDASPAAAYMPIDISADFLRNSAMQLHREYPAVPIIAVCADYTRLEALPETGSRGRRVVFFPGSTVGNLDPSEARRFFRRTSALLNRGDALLIGADLRKEDAILHAAYNDSRGVTAEFNLNLLHRINREVGGSFDLERFSHVAFFNEQESRIEMHLRTDFAHTVEVGGERFRFEAGEMIHTENSYKYDLAMFHSLFSESRFEPREVWYDEARLFSMHYLEVV